MAIFIGTTSVSSLFVGTTSITDMYVGTGSVFDSSGGGSSDSATAPTSVSIESYPYVSPQTTLGITWTNQSTSSTNHEVDLTITNLPTSFDSYDVITSGTVTDVEYSYASDSVTNAKYGQTATSLYSSVGSTYKLIFDVTVSGGTTTGNKLKAGDDMQLSGGNFALNIIDGTADEFQLDWVVPSGHSNTGYILQYKKTAPAESAFDWTTFLTADVDDYTTDEINYSISGNIPHTAETNDVFSYRVISVAGSSQSSATEESGSNTYNLFSHTGSISNLAHAADTGE